MNDLRTPLARARGLGSGKTGTEHFWVQRVTAIALALLVPWLLYLLISMAGHDAAHAIALIRAPLNAILLAAFSTNLAAGEQLRASLLLVGVGQMMFLVPTLLSGASTLGPADGPTATVAFNATTLGGTTPSITFTAYLQPTTNSR